MRKLFSFMAISVDGYHTDDGGTADWQTFGSEFADYSVEQLDEVDTLVFGRTTYEELRAYWTSDLGTGFDPRIADRMNARRKLVVSRTLRSVEWPGSEAMLVTIDQLARLKRTAERDLAVFGSSTLTATLLDAGLVDELRLIVNPVLLGGGAKVYDGIGTVPLTLDRVRPFQSGNVLLYYRPAEPT